MGGFAWSPASSCLSVTAKSPTPPDYDGPQVDVLVYPNGSFDALPGPTEPGDRNLLGWSPCGRYVHQLVSQGWDVATSSEWLGGYIWDVQQRQPAFQWRESHGLRSKHVIWAESSSTCFVPGLHAILAMPAGGTRSDVLQLPVECPEAWCPRSHENFALSPCGTLLVMSWSPGDKDQARLEAHPNTQKSSWERYGQSSCLSDQFWHGVVKFGKPTCMLQPVASQSFICDFGWHGNLAWHPHPAALLYAVSDDNVRKVSLVDGRTHKVIRFWDLGRPRLPIDVEELGTHLRWSPDGSILVVTGMGTTNLIKFHGLCWVVAD